MVTTVSKPSFIRFAYPLRFSDDFLTIASMIEGLRWPRSPDGITVWKGFGGERRDTFGHFGRHINPPRRDEQTTALLWEITEEALTDEAGLWNERSWELRYRQRTVGVFRFVGAELLLFRTGIGFVTICAQPEYDTELDQWLNFQHYFRYANDHRRVRIRASRPVADGPDVPYFPAPAGGIESLNDRETGVVRLIIDGLLRPWDGADFGRKWWDEPYLQGFLFPFAALYIEGLEDERVAHALYRVRNVFRTDQGNAPADEDLSLQHPGLLPYAKRQWFSFSLSGGSFLALDAPRLEDTGGQFARITLSDHLGGIYYLLLLIVLQQRFKLMSLSETVVREWPVGGGEQADDDRERALRRARDDLMLFTARGLFSQIAPTEHHHRVYRRWQEIFEIDRLYREVGDEIHEMHRYIETQRAQAIECREREAARQAQLAQERVQRLEHLVAVLAAVFAGPSLALAYLSATGPVSRPAALNWSAAGFAVGVAVVVAVHILAGHWRRPSRLQRAVISVGRRALGRSEPSAEPSRHRASGEGEHVG